MVVSNETPTFTSLKDLVPLYPLKTPTPPFSRRRSVVYSKIKEPSLGDGGARVYWQAVPVLGKEDAGDMDFGVPCGGLFEFIDKYFLKPIRRWIDRLLGGLLNLPKFEEYM